MCNVSYLLYLLRLKNSHQHLIDTLLIYLSKSQDQLSLQMFQDWQAGIRFGSDGHILENGGQQRNHFRAADELIFPLKRAVQWELKFTIKKNNYLNIFQR